MENKAIHILQSARRNGVFISVNDDQLSIKYSKGKNIDTELVEEITQNKELIIDFLNNKKSTLRKTLKIQ
ncbi:MAG: hypothetical protein WKF59_24175 [Chitinophagaceae bacterium]